MLVLMRLAAVLLLACAPAWCTWALVGSVDVQEYASGTGPYTSGSLTNTAGNLLVVSISVHNATAVNSVTDSGGDTFHLAASPSEFSNHGYIYYAYGIAGGANQVTVALAASAQNVIFTAEYGAGSSLSSDPFEVAAVGSAGGSSSTTATTASFSPAAAHNLNVAIGFDGNGSYNAAGSGYAHLTPSVVFSGGEAVEDKVDAASGAQTASMTNSSASFWGIGVASFTLPAGGGGGGSTPGFNKRRKLDKLEASIR